MSSYAEDLPQLLALLKKHGVRRFKNAEVEIDFAPVEPKPLTAADLKDLAAEDDSEKCGCGHQPWQHTNGLCSQGCPMDKCLPEEAKQ